MNECMEVKLRGVALPCVVPVGCQASTYGTAPMMHQRVSAISGLKCDRMQWTRPFATDMQGDRVGALCMYACMPGVPACDYALQLVCSLEWQGAGTAWHVLHTYMHTHVYIHVCAGLCMRVGVCRSRCTHQESLGFASPALKKVHTSVTASAQDVICTARQFGSAEPIAAAMSRTCSGPSGAQHLICRTARAVTGPSTSGCPHGWHTARCGNRNATRTQGAAARSSLDCAQPPVVGERGW